MKRILLPLMALISSVSTFAYDVANEGWQYSCGTVKVIGLANGKVAVTDVWLGAGETSVTIPAKAHATWNNTENASCDLTFEIQQVGYGTWGHIYVERESTSFLSSVTSVTIEEGVSSINASAFNEATSLQHLTLPASLSTIGDEAFRSCDALKAIYFNGSTAPACGANAFTGNSAWDTIVKSCKVYVSSYEAKESFNQDPWTYFTAFYSNGNVVYHTIDLWEDYYGDYDSHNNHLVNLTLHRTFLAADGWNTICIPADISEWNITNAFGEGVEVMELTSSAVNNEELQLIFSESKTWITACKPYLIRVAADVENPSFSAMSFNNTASTTVSTTYADMVGALETIVLDGTRYCLGSSNYLYHPETTVSLSGYRAYFTLSPSTPTDIPARIVIKDNSATNVDNVNSDKVRCTKMLRDGQILIVREGRTYTIDGRCIQ
ncbi:MAG: leucine-rich repeat protein [Paludibacteraceae bacterium]